MPFPVAASAGAALTGDPVTAAGRLLDALDATGHPGPLVLAVSGGGDSVALLRAFAGAEAGLRHPPRRIVVATVDHGLRAGSRQEAAWVAALSARLGFSHRLLAWQGEKPANGLQVAAREARHRLLAALASEIGAAAVVTAHDRDDQRETLAMRAERIRAASQPDIVAEADGAEADSRSVDGIRLRGLAGIAPATLVEGGVWFLRPFLGLARAALRAWLGSIGQDWLEDPSNDDPRFERVRVRGRLAEGDAGDGAWVRAACNLAHRRTALAAAAGNWLRARVVVHGGIVATFPDDAACNTTPAGLEAIATLVAILGGRSHRPATDRLPALVAFLAAPAMRRMTVSRVVLERADGQIHLLRERRGLPVPIALSAGETVLWDGRYRITAPSAGGRQAGVHVAPASDRDVARALAGGRLSTLRPSIARRALAAEPALAPLATAASPDAGCLFRGEEPACATVERHIGLFDRFLPLFDLDVAQATATLFGRAAYPEPPVSRDFLLRQAY